MEPALQTQIQMAEAYETLMVPALFGEWAPRIADAARIRPGQRVLDVACGTGVLSREVASRTGPTGAVVGLDPNAGMLEVAKRISPALEFRRGVAELLPFPDHSFDAVVSQFGLMFFTDRHRALQEAFRVLVPGCRFAIAVWNSLDHMPAYAAEVALLEEVAGQQAADALRAPFALGGRDGLATLFEQAGAVSAEISTAQGTARFPSLRVMLEADLRGWLPITGVVLSEEQIARILRRAESLLAPFVTADGTVVFETSTHIIIGTKF